MTEDMRGRAQVVYDKTNVKSAWLSDILLCIEMHQRGAVFDSDEAVKYASSSEVEDNDDELNDAVGEATYANINEQDENSFRVDNPVQRKRVSSENVSSLMLSSLNLENPAAIGKKSQLETDNASEAYLREEEYIPVFSDDEYAVEEQGESVERDVF